jgi:hypothetical protein
MIIFKIDEIINRFSGELIQCEASTLTSHLSPLTSHLSPLTSHLSPLTSHLSPFTSPLISVFHSLYYLCTDDDVLF